MANMKHTPWTLEGPYYDDKSGQYYELHNAKGEEIAGEYGIMDHEALANAVNVINCHDELVAALRDLEGGFFGSLMSAAGAASSNGNVIVPVDLIKLWDAKLHTILAKATKGE